ncbi:hypothetical protein EDD16DRAFT_1728355 [Pisolithus croceorrhizus]|nr:hypothetical protein EDD16DRAFT_1728355 [Pisolithus croceorrhizus]KAI6159677.1 hypothetical protein EDD17DRAFT_1511108 [Pisolithus thermaeus]
MVPGGGNSPRHERQRPLTSISLLRRHCTNYRLQPSDGEARATAHSINTVLIKLKYGYIRREHEEPVTRCCRGHAGSRPTSGVRLGIDTVKLLKPRARGVADQNETKTVGDIKKLVTIWTSHQKYVAPFGCLRTDLHVVYGYGLARQVADGGVEVSSPRSNFGWCNDQDSGGPQLNSTQTPGSCLSFFCFCGDTSCRPPSIFFPRKTALLSLQLRVLQSVTVGAPPKQVPSEKKWERHTLCPRIRRPISDS